MVYLHCLHVPPNCFNEFNGCFKLASAFLPGIKSKCMSDLGSKWKCFCFVCLLETHKLMNSLACSVKRGTTFLKVHVGRITTSDTLPFNSPLDDGTHDYYYYCKMKISYSIFFY